MQFSIIVPVFNEAPLIRRFLAHLRERAPGAEIIVADGGSTDGTADLAAGFCDQLVESQRSRAAQMNAGTHAARGEILWFLHADVEVPVQCLDEIARIMHNSNVIGGYFRIRLPRRLVYRLTDSFAHYAGMLLRIRCGDHGIFCRRTAFISIGGFPRTGPIDIRLWIHRNALYFPRPTLVARVDLQTNVLRGAIADGAAAEIIRDFRGACPERSRRAQNDNDGLRFCSFLTCSSSLGESYLPRFYERFALGS